MLITPENGSADPCAGHSCDGCPTCRSGVCCQSRRAPARLGSRPLAVEPALVCSPKSVATERPSLEALLLEERSSGRPGLVDLVVGVKPSRPFRARPLELASVPDPHWRPLAQDENGCPVTWRADRRIRYAVNPYLGYPGFVDDVIRVMMEVRKFTGLPFDFYGTIPMGRDEFEAGRTPRDVQLFVGWVPNTQLLGSTESAIATARTKTKFDPELERTIRYRGTILLAADYELSPGFVRSGWGPVIRHEVGHAVGLDHVQSGSEVMRPGSYREIVDWGPGDLAGLGALGALSASEVAIQATGGASPSSFTANVARGRSHNPKGAL